MAKNSIVDRVKAFLEAYPPFTRMTTTEVQLLAEQVSIRYARPQEVLFQQGDRPGAVCYLVREGAVRIQQEGTLIDLCDEGDLFGVRPLIADDNYLADAVVEEEALLYELPVQVLKQVMADNAAVALFFAADFAAGRSQYQQAMSAAGEGIKVWQTGGDTEGALLAPIAIDAQKTVISTSSSHTIQEAAQRMRDHRVGSIIVVDKEQYPVGIITDTDLRNRIATGEVQLTAPVATLMHHPVVTIAPHATLADCLMTMAQHRVHHLVATEDGTNQSPVAGIISDHDLLLELGNHPALYLKEIRKVTTAEELKAIRDRFDRLLQTYLKQQVDIQFIARMATSINDALTQRCIELAKSNMPAAPEGEWCWWQLGSGARSEQLIRTDQDHALLFESSKPDAMRAWLLKLAEEVSQYLEIIGFVPDPAGVSATNPKWCLSISEWKEQFHQWIHQPEAHNLLLSTIFFDYRPVFGSVDLSRQFTDWLYSELGKQDLFLGYMAKNALQNPSPLGFFRQFLLESSGNHEDEFDLKLRVMLPFVDAARVITLEHKIQGINSTVERYMALAEKEPKNKALFEEAALSFEVLLRLRARFGFAGHHTGRYINIEALTKLERQMLRNIFKTLKALQQVLEVRFQLNYIR